MKQLLIITIVFFLISCEREYLPKPRGYNRIDLPSFAYQPLPDTFPYYFEFSKHARLLKDTSWNTEPYWIDLYYPEMDANVQITYKRIMRDDSLMQGYFRDAYKLTYQHNVKAYAIEEQILELPNGTFASISDLEGEVPSQFQFHVSDSVNHFLRGALYFKTATKNDSLQPVINYIKTDIIHMLQSLEWR